MTEKKPEIEPGDHVYVGETGTVHWIVDSITRASNGVLYARLRSGMTGHRRTRPVADLRLHSKAGDHASP